MKYIEETEDKFKELGVGQFASVSGRYYAMDRDKRWDREERAYNAIRNFEGPTFTSAKAGVEANYKNDVTDEFVEPFIVEGQNDGVNDGDAVIFIISVQIEQLNFQKSLLIKRLMDLKLNKWTTYSTQHSRNIMTM